MKLLLIEDDKDLCNVLSYKLQEEGYQIDSCFSGDEAIYYGESASYDLIILDRMLPYIDGLTVLQTFRKNGITTPVIMLTAMNGIHDRIDGLDAGADDYLIKPFDIGELCARIRALARRPRTIENARILHFSNFDLDTIKHLLSVEEKTVTLTSKESNLLEFFIRNRGQILTREQILTRVWGFDSSIDDGNLDNYIYFIRRRLKTTHCLAKVKTVYAVGYQLEEL